MYRLTFSEPLSRTWWSQRQARSPTPTPIQRTVYRWGTCWGYRDPADYRSVTCTTTQHSTKDVLVERAEEESATLPPPQVDDVWNEEVFYEGPAEYTGILRVTGFADELKAWCEAAELSCPPLPTLSPLIQKAMALQRSNTHS